MGAKSAVNKRFKMDADGTIIGVMKDFHFLSLQQNIEPLAITVTTKNINYLLIRLTAGNMPAGIDFVKETWNRLVPNYPFDYRFVDEVLDQQYAGWGRVSELLRYFAILAILIACLGLFGLASFTAEQRTKEIGVRKVLGASIISLIILMSKEFSKWVLIANIIAWPVAYYIMNMWLKDFAYRIEIGLKTFVLAGSLAIIIALLTVFYQSLKAATANPADSLKYE